MGRLEDKVAIITGAAKGIGENVAKLFAREGARVVVTNVSEEEAKKVAAEINSEGHEAIFVKLDVSKEEDWKRAMDATVEKYGKLNILVNNAGVSLGKNIEETTREEWDRVMDINSTGVFLGTKYGIETMKKNNEMCSIINRSSIDAMIGEAGLCAYCASKGSVRSLTKSAALHCGEMKYKIRVNSVHPGYVRTALTEKEAKDSGLSNEQYFTKVGKMHPIGHIGEPLDIAYLDLYLASDESRWVTGSEYVIDGGYTAM
ncbi:MAG TPA: glucose 1-dehydrogenase [Spirochaetes bacterium]|nr:glucose 1-dehydrogenase [Spirochaetota bacterium]